MKGFLAQIAEYIKTQHPEGMQDVTLCFPNNRAGYFFADELNELLSKGDRMPQISTLEKWILGLSHSALVQNVELIDFLFKSYTEVGGTDSFEVFIPTAQVMLADFDELDKQLVNPKGLFKDLNDIKSLNTFLEDETTLTEYSKSYREFWNLFRDCYFKLTDTLRSANKAYQGMIYRELAEGIASFNFTEVSKIYFVGFSGLSKSEQRIIAQLMDADKAEFLIDADSYYMNSSRQEAGYFFREYKKSWRIKSFKWEQSFISQYKKKIEVIGVARSIGQAKLTGDILQNHLHLNETNLKDTVVVLPDEKLLQPLLNALPDSISHVNITMGLPLSYMQLADLMRHLSDMQNNAKLSLSSDKKRFYHRDVIALIQHSYFRLLARNKEAIPEAVRYIRSNNKVTVTKEELLNWFKDDKELIDILFQRSDSVAEYIQHLLKVTDLLAARFLLILKANEKEVETDLEVLYWLKKVLTNLQGQLVVFEQVWDIKSLQKLIESELRMTRLPFESEKTHGLQVMGMMETRALDFKNLIILSMNEGVFPSGKTFSTFFPYDLRKAHGMTTHKDRDAVAAYLFYRLLQRAENIYLVYNTESDLLGGGEKSRFILQIQHELAGFDNIEITEQNFVLGADVNQTESKIEVVKNDGVMHLLKTYLSVKGLSPTGLNSYINCSLQFYFKNILGLREQEDIEEDMEAGTIGTAVHYALEMIFREVMNRPLQASYLKNVITDTDLIGRLIKENLRDRFDEESLKQGKNYLLYNVCKSLVLNFLKNELRRVEELAATGKTTTITHLEQAMEQRIDLNGLDMRIHGFTDRVELIEGIPNIADYKTGDAKKGKVKIDEMEELKTSPDHSKALQLMIYGWLYSGQYGKQARGIRSGIYWLRHAEGKYEALVKDKTDLISESMLNSFEKTLREILNDMTNKNIPFTKTEDKDRCKFCDFVRICGRD